MTDDAVTVPGALPDVRTTVVIITRNRRPELLRTLAKLAALPERPVVIVADNASTDGTAEAARAAGSRGDSGRVDVIELDRNTGAIGRNIAVRHVRTPYVAFCDDDTWWEPGALRRAADILDAHPSVAALTGRILVEPGGREDPIVEELRDSPVPARDGLPGPALGSILAGASIVRTAAFRAVGGFHPRIWLGGEEELLAADLLAAGWTLCFAEHSIVHHEPSGHREPALLRSRGIRNTLWFLWLRRPLPSALRNTAALLRRIPRNRTSASALADALLGVGWVLRERKVVPPEVEAAYQALEKPQRHSTARRYVG